MKNSKINNIMSWLDQHYRLFLTFLLLIYFINSYMAGLLKGGRWDLYQHIAMADRYLAGKGFYYSAVEASTPYFPGVGFLAVIIGKMFNPWRDYILLFIASFIGGVFMYLLACIGRKNCKDKWIPLLLVGYAAFGAFGSYRLYMNEFKADSLVMIYGFLLVWMINEIESESKKASFLSLFLIFVISFLMDITKQQALYVDAALGAYLLFSHRVPLTKRLALLSMMIFGGILAMIVVFSIPGMRIQAIQNLADMPYWSLTNIIREMRQCFLQHIWFFLCLFYFAYLLVKKKVELDGIAVKWLIVALFMGAGQIVGGMKSGGNSGNYEAGMIGFLPFMMIALDKVYCDVIVEEKKNGCRMLLILLVCFFAANSLAISAYQGRLLVAKIKGDREVSSYLSETAGEETIMYYSDQYMQIARSSTIPGMDIYSVPTNIKEYRHLREETLHSREYRYLYVNPNDLTSGDEYNITFFGEQSNAAGALEENYIPIDDPEMPEALRGQLFILR